MTDAAAHDRPLDSWITLATYPSSNNAARASASRAFIVVAPRKFASNPTRSSCTAESSWFSNTRRSSCLCLKVFTVVATSVPKEMDREGMTMPMSVGVNILISYWPPSTSTYGAFFTSSKTARKAAAT